MTDTASPDAEAREVLGAAGAGRTVLEPLVHNPRNGVTAGVWRVRAGDRSAVLKVLTRSKEAEGRWAASDEPRHWNHWRREAHVYESNLAQAWQPYGIRAPRLLACVERPDGDVALWLEDVPGEPATAWTVDRHAEHARRLGAAQGAVGGGGTGTGCAGGVPEGPHRHPGSAPDAALPRLTPPHAACRPPARRLPFRTRQVTGMTRPPSIPTASRYGHHPRPPLSAAFALRASVVTAPDVP